MAPDPSYLLEKLNFERPLIGVYDTPETELFHPLIFMPEKQRACLFEYYENWMNGVTLVINKDRYGCGGCGTWWFDRQTRTREDYLDFLANKEGLKANKELMGTWFDLAPRFQPANKYMLVGPLRNGAYEFLKTITFYVNPDQLSVLLTGAQYFQAYTGHANVTVDFGSGCMEMLNLLDGKPGPRGIVGATDMAMRENLPREILAFTVNKEMFEELCLLDENSFLEKPFLRILRNSRGGKLA